MNARRVDQKEIEVLLKVIPHTHMKARGRWGEPKKTNDIENNLKQFCICKNYLTIDSAAFSYSVTPRYM